MNSFKRNIGISWMNSIFTRITVTFLAILLPLYILGILIYNSALQSVQREISSSMNSQVTFYMASLEKEIQRIWYLECDMMNDTYLNRLSAIPESMNDIDRMQAIRNLQSRLEAVKNSSMYIGDLTVYIPAIGRTINDRSLDVLDEGVYKKLIAACNPSLQIQYLQGTPVILIESPFMDSSTGEPMYIFNIKLDIQAFSAALAQFNKYPGSGSFLTAEDTGGNIASANMNKNVEQQIISLMQSGMQGILSMKSGGKTVSGMYICTSSKSLGMTLGLYVPEDVVFLSIRQYQKWFWIFTLAAAMIIFAFSYSMYRFIHKPLMQLVGAFEKVEEGNLEIAAIEHHQKDEFRYLYRRFNVMVENLGNLIRQVYTMKILNQKAELKQLQSQINPHFLYNSFFILHRRIKGGDYDNALAFSQQLGNYFRFITRSADDEVPLEREVDHARIYADIQRIRFSSRMSVEFGELPDEFRNVIVPRLILQPIIENAFEHGLENKVSGGLLRIAFEPEAGAGLRIVIEDNGESLGDAELEQLRLSLGGDDQTERTGVINIHWRLRLKFGEGSGLSVIRSPLGGLRVEMHIAVNGGDRNE